VKTSKISGMTVYYGQKWVSQRKVHEGMENSKCEGKEMLLLMLSTFVVVVVRQSWHMLFVMYYEVIAQTDKCTGDKQRIKVDNICISHG